ncbi:MAG: prefoldin subunit alpha [Candidatus Methanomethylophilaceae archaeon]|jgi:prefoldin alpha subunit
MDDGELRQALQVLESYKEQMDALSRRISVLQISLEETFRARETLRQFSEAKEGDEILVPVGASVFVRAKVTGSDSAIVGIGNRVSVEKKLSDAEDYMNSGYTEIEEALRTASKALNDMSTIANNLAETINAEYEARQNA